MGVPLSVACVSVSEDELMEYKEIYEQYKKDHPEEMVNLNRIYGHTKKVERTLAARKKEKLKKIEECRRLLYGEEYPK